VSVIPEECIVKFRFSKVATEDTYRLGFFSKGGAHICLPYVFTEHPWVSESEKKRFVPTRREDEKGVFYIIRIGE
jgi:hypothetical protein